MCMGFFWFCFFLQISTHLLEVSINLQFYTRLFRAMEIITDRIKKQNCPLDHVDLCHFRFVLA